jgi:hypothetical protein
MIEHDTKIDDQLMRMLAIAWAGAVETFKAHRYGDVPDGFYYTHFIPAVKAGFRQALEEGREAYEAGMTDAACGVVRANLMAIGVRAALKWMSDQKGNDET